MGAHIGRPTWYTLLTTFAAFQAAVGKIKVGTYVGNGAATKTITGVGFQPDAILIINLSVGSITTQIWISGMAADKSIHVVAGSYVVDHIKSVNTDGFVVGDGTGDVNRMNVNAANYCFVCLKATI